MAIKISCACGKRFSVTDGQTGRKVRCPTCQATRSIASPKRTWSQMVIPIVIAVVAAVPAWFMFGDMVRHPTTIDEFIKGLVLVIGSFVVVGILPWFLYVNLRSKPVNQQPEVDAPEFSAESVIWRASGAMVKPISVVVDRAAGLIHFQNCVLHGSFWPRPPLPWLSCSLSDVRCFHDRLVKSGNVLAIKTNFGKVTLNISTGGDYQSLLQMMDAAIPGGRRRFHEDSFLAILLYVISGVATAVLTLALVSDRLPPKLALWLMLGSAGVVTLAVSQAISIWSGKPSLKR